MEIVRFSALLNTSIRGALSKLWSAFLKTGTMFSSVISYSDLRYFSGESNSVLGFKKIDINPPGFYYTKDYKILENRLRYQKHKLSKILSQVDPTLTEWENMQIAGYDRIWDCGTVVWEYVPL